jgi:hypothetical protein
MKWLKDFYREKEADTEKLTPSWAEMVLFLISLILFVIYAVFILCTKTSLSPKLSILLVPTLLWVFIRASRKDMNATAALAAGLFGDGAIGVIMTKLLPLIFP